MKMIDEKPWRFVLLINVVVLVVGAPIALWVRGMREPNVYNDGLTILHDTGPSKAEDYFEPWASSGDIEGMFGFAWATYLRGNYHRAVRLAEYIVIEGNDNQRARGLFLLGSVQMKYGDEEKAFAKFGDSLLIYQELGNEIGVYRCRLNLAAASINEGNPTRAIHILELAAKEKPKKEYRSSKAFSLYLSSQAAFALGEHERALELIETCLATYDSRNGEINALAEWGYQLILLGRLDEGREKTEQALSMLNPEEDENKVYYLNINLVVLDRCSGRDPIALATEIRKRAVEDRDKLLQRHLTRALNHDCKKG